MVACPVPVRTLEDCSIFSTPSPRAAAGSNRCSPYLPGADQAHPSASPCPHGARLSCKRVPYQGGQSSLDVPGLPWRSHSLESCPRSSTRARLGLPSHVRRSSITTRECAEFREVPASLCQPVSPQRAHGVPWGPGGGQKGRVDMPPSHSWDPHPTSCLAAGWDRPSPWGTPSRASLRRQRLSPVGCRVGSPPSRAHHSPDAHPAAVPTPCSCTWPVSTQGPSTSLPQQHLEEPSHPSPHHRAPSSSGLIYIFQ